MPRGGCAVLCVFVLSLIYFRRLPGISFPVHIQLLDVLISYASCRSSSLHVRIIDNPTSFNSLYFAQSLSSGNTESVPHRKRLPDSSVHTTVQFIVSEACYYLCTTSPVLSNVFAAHRRVLSHISCTDEASLSASSLSHTKLQVDNFDSPQKFKIVIHSLSSQTSVLQSLNSSWLFSRMTEYAPHRGSQDFNIFLPAGNHAMSHYQNHAGVNYLFNNGQVQYTAVNPNYSTYSTQCLPSQHSANPTTYLPSSSPMAYNYQPSFSRTPMIPSQPHAVTTAHSFSPQTAQRPQIRDVRYESYSIPDTESQESFNEDTRASEPVEPAMEGYPDVKEFDDLMKR